MIAIRHAIFPDDTDIVTALLREYIASVTVDLAFQDYETELANLPGAYGAPGGGLLLCRDGDDYLGCAAFRRVNHTTCEMKRVYLRPAARGQRLGRRLVESLLAAAKDAGYERICLDVLPEFASARRLYRALGFLPAEPVSFNPVPGTQFLSRAL